MSHDVTATKYRPQTFEDLVGQEFVSAALKNSLNNHKIANAFLLSGPRGVGKTSTARILAKGINCVNGPTGSPCNTCENCITIKNGNNQDVIEIDGASNTGIANIKLIQEEILYKPIKSKYKIYIIDEVHMLSTSAFNALLKTIEEPPEHIVFIFATTEINKVLPTIRSRCQQFNLRLIPIDIIQKSLTTILKQKNIPYENEAVLWIAKEGKGSMRDSYTLLDQVISFCEKEITLDKIINKLGIISEENVVLLLKMIGENNIERILFEKNKILSSGLSSELLIIEIIKYLRNLLLIKTNRDTINCDFNKNLYTEDLLALFNTEDIENIIEIAFSTYEKIKDSINPDFDIELFFIRIVKFKDFIRPRQIIKQLNLLKNQITEKLIENSDFEKKKITSDKEATKQDLNIKAEKSDILKTLISQLKNNYPDISNNLENIVRMEESHNNLTIVVTKPLSFDLINKNINIISNSISKILNRPINLKIKLENTQGTSESNFDKNIKLISNIFNGNEII